MKRSLRLLSGTLAVGSLSLSLAGCGGSNATAPDVTGFTQSTPAAQSAAAVQAQEFRSDGVSMRHINIIYKDKTIASNLGALASQYNVTFEHQMPQINAVVARIPDGVQPEDVVNRMKNDPRVKSVQLSHKVSLDVIRRGGTPPTFPLLRDGLQVNDPLFSQQYGMAKISAAAAWEVTMGSPSVKIAMIDTGVDLNHPDLKDKLVPGMNIPDPNSPPQDDDGHGTHTACIAGASVNNGIGVTGVGAKVSIMPVKVLTNGGGTEAQIAEGIVWAADHGADVASMSLGLYKRSDVLEKALQYALDHNVVLTASAGNNGAQNDPNTAPHLPSTYPGVIEVAASDQNDQKADFSNFGNTLAVGAPGVDVLSCLPVDQNSYGTMSGTSMAAPHAAGLAGLIRSQHPKLAPAQVKKLMQDAADKLGAAGFDPGKFGWGRINAFAAVKK